MADKRSALMVGLGLMVLPLPASAVDSCDAPTCTGDAHSCQTDACGDGTWRTQEIPFSSVQLSWQRSGVWHHCSGTLLNDSSESNRLLVLTAGYCFDANRNGTVSASEQSDAERTLRAYFNRIPIPCASGTPNSVLERRGGQILEVSTPSQYWYTSEDAEPYSTVAFPNELDFALVQVQGSPPPGATLRFAGWEGNDHSNSSDAMAMVHYPWGDTAKVAVKQYGLGYNPSSGYMTVQGWAHGGPTYGSAGAGLVTSSGLLRGAWWGSYWDLFEGPPEESQWCADPDETDALSTFVDFEALYPSIAGHLGATDSAPPRWFHFCESGEGTLDYEIPAGNVLNVQSCAEVSLKDGFHAQPGSSVQIAP